MQPCEQEAQQLDVALCDHTSEQLRTAFPLPLRYISQAELASVSGYMRGRLTIETVNSAIDDAASHSEANAKLMAATKSNSVKPADRKRATTLLHCVTVSPMCHLPVSMLSTRP